MDCPQCGDMDCCKNELARVGSVIYAEVAGTVIRLSNARVLAR